MRFEEFKCTQSTFWCSHLVSIFSYFMRYNSLDNKEHIDYDLLDEYLQVIRKNLDIPENNEPGPGELECGNLDELAEGKDTDAKVLRAEELDEERYALGGDEGKHGEIQKEADGYLGTPAIEEVGTRLTKLDQTLPSNYLTYLKLFLEPNISW